MLNVRTGLRRGVFRRCRAGVRALFGESAAVALPRPLPSSNVVRGSPSSSSPGPWPSCCVQPKAFLNASPGVSLTDALGVVIPVANGIGDDGHVAGASRGEGAKCPITLPPDWRDHGEASARAFQSTARGRNPSAPAPRTSWSVAVTTRMTRCALAEVLLPQRPVDLEPVGLDHISGSLH